MQCNAMLPKGKKAGYRRSDTDLDSLGRGENAAGRDVRQEATRPEFSQPSTRDRLVLSGVGAKCGPLATSKLELCSKLEM